MSLGGEEGRSFTGFSVQAGFGTAFALFERKYAQPGQVVLRLTLLTSAVASGIFVATLVFAPSVIDIGNLVGFGQTEISRESSSPVVAPKGRDCRSPLAKIIAALQHAPCS